MKKYIVIALLLIVAQGNIYGARHSLNSMITAELATAKQSMNIDRLELDLDKVLQALSENAKINMTQYYNAFIQLASIKKALETKRNEQYDSAWSKFMWTFGVYPEFVTTDINPAIKRINETSFSIYNARVHQILNDATYIGKTFAAGALLFAAGAALSYVMQPKKTPIPMAQEVLPSAPAEEYTVAKTV